MGTYTPRRAGATLPPCNSSSLVEDGRKRSSSETQQLVPEPFQSIPAQELLKDNCRKCGWIRKEGGSIKTWRDRYVIIHKGCLYYYNKPEATTTAGKFSLSGYRLSPAPEKSSKFQWTFKLVHLQPEKRTYYFAAYSEKEMTEWVESITTDMSEYCGNGRQNIVEPSDTGDIDYCYPEVEPKFDLAALFVKPPLPVPGPGLTVASQPTSEEMYCPPPDIDCKDVQRKSPCLPRPTLPSPQPGHGRQKMAAFSYTASIGGNRIPGGSPLLRPIRQPSPGSSPLFSHKSNVPQTLPSRHGKPLPPPKPLPRPPLTKHATEPILKHPILQSDEHEDEEGEGYLDIVPDTRPEDVTNEGRQSTLSRGFPDGRSFRQHHNEDVLPASALRLDMDKMDVPSLLENKRGVYILRGSQNAQSKRALSVWTGDRVRHYMIFYDEKLGYALDPDGPRFDKIEDLLRHYYDFDLPKCDVKLKRPYK